MDVIIFGASGMVGGGVLLECLDDDRVASVVTVGRRKTGKEHPKLRELILEDMFDFAALRDAIGKPDACCFCLGITAAGMSEEAYRRVTFDLTIAVADVLAEVNPVMRFLYVTGRGTDAAGTGRFMWARVKGETENRLLEMSFDAYMFRPGLIQPMKGVRSRTGWYQAFYSITRPLLPLLKKLFPKQITTTVDLGLAMIEVAIAGAPSHVLETEDINAMAGRAERR